MHELLTVEYLAKYHEQLYTSCRVGEEIAWLLCGCMRTAPTHMQ